MNCCACCKYFKDDGDHDKDDFYDGFCKINYDAVRCEDVCDSFEYITLNADTKKADVKAMNNVITTDDSNYIHKYLSLTKERRYVLNKIIDTLVQIEEKERTNK